MYKRRKGEQTVFSNSSSFVSLGESQLLTSPVASNLNLIYFILKQVCSDSVIRYFIFSFHYSIFFTLLGFFNDRLWCVANDVVFMEKFFYAFIFTLRLSFSGSETIFSFASLEREEKRFKNSFNIFSAASTGNKILVLH